ncbi:tRNA 2-selenouridine(34) synthase MnmH [Draconibacterium sp. IB214405]|uniref:tRNA 2-selenouridine(34) synthase MnmH n=1 Tax=Draconibacterium sp. IB214405 TaxID=3097352 RepID=UPI002A118CE0|nr:tRNA 2-selenouridine(34) synthase MnmH [Draconibacterium sp. IB214405]MDX8340356.1 tRNA 2-selenouridine(34) synthase MnmH [Draconibacterium sp. IB214405]
MLQEISVSDYIQLATKVPLVDVRSPGEYEKGHIPGAFSIPLFSNDERAAVGTVYVQQSKEEAIELGYKYVTPKLEWFISESRKLAPDGVIAVHCWRGGMRSRSFAQHLSDNGFSKVYVITGGYKAFRNYALESFKTEAKICILGGYTGSGKTHILYALKELGEQIIDLEGLANHKGSAFGRIGDGKQPTIEQFENDLFWEWKDLDYGRTIWIEDESHRIGLVNIPMNFFENMRSQPVIFLDIALEERAEFLVRDYSAADKAMLKDSILRIKKRLGGLNTQKALEHLERNELYEVAMICLIYYDKYYLRGLRNRDHQEVFTLMWDSISPKVISKSIVEFYESIRNKKYKAHPV